MHRTRANDSCGGVFNTYIGNTRKKYENERYDIITRDEDNIILLYRRRIRIYNIYLQSPEGLTGWFAAGGRVQYMCGAREYFSPRFTAHPFTPKTGARALAFVCVYALVVGGRGDRYSRHRGLSAVYTYIHT